MLFTFYLDSGISTREGRSIGGVLDKSASTVVQISLLNLFEADTSMESADYHEGGSSEATLFRTAEEDAVRVNYRKPDTTLRCSLWWHINHEYHHTYTGQHDAN
jgi:hypothetical protein